MTTPKTLTANEWFTKYVRMPGGTLSFVEIAIAATHAKYPGTPEQCKAAMELAEYVSRHDVQPCPSLMDHRAAVKLARTALELPEPAEDKQE